MLRKIRIGISVVLFSLITFFFLDFAGILPNSFHRLAHLQFIPALLSLCRYTYILNSIDIAFRTFLLFYHLSDGNFSGYSGTCIEICRKEKEKIWL